MAVQFIKRERDSHWYQKDGTPRHEVPYADPSRGMRPTTLRDAKKLGLVPSVTNILAIKDKPALTAWKLEQAILSAITLPKKDGESQDDFAIRVAEDMEQESRKAAEFGTLLHDEIEFYNLNGAFSATGEILSYLEGYETWFRQNVAEVICAETSIIGMAGYAGRLDVHVRLLDGRRAIVDAKTQKLKGKPKPNFYKEWAMQLAAYGDPLREGEESLPALISIVLPSDTPNSPAFTHEWEDGEAALDAFLACHKLWCWDKGYTP